MVDGKLVLHAETMKKLFQKTIDNILTNIESALKFNQSEKVSMIILVGGFRSMTVSLAKFVNV
jgi:hypothetical protein